MIPYTDSFTYIKKKVYTIPYTCIRILGNILNPIECVLFFITNSNKVVIFLR